MNDGFAIFLALLLSAFLGIAVWNDGFWTGILIFGSAIVAFTVVGLCDRYFHPNRYR